MIMKINGINQYETFECQAEIIELYGKTFYKVQDASRNRKSVYIHLNGYEIQALRVSSKNKVEMRTVDVPLNPICNEFGEITYDDVEKKEVINIKVSIDFTCKQRLLVNGVKRFISNFDGVKEWYYYNEEEVGIKKCVIENGYLLEIKM